MAPCTSWSTTLDACSSSVTKIWHFVELPIYPPPPPQRWHANVVRYDSRIANAELWSFSRAGASGYEACWMAVLGRISEHGEVRMDHFCRLAGPTDKSADRPEHRRWTDRRTDTVCINYIPTDQQNMPNDPPTDQPDGPNRSTATSGSDSRLNKTSFCKTCVDASTTAWQASTSAQVVPRRPH